VLFDDDTSTCNFTKKGKNFFEDSSRSLLFEKLLRFNYRETQERIMCYWNKMGKLIHFKKFKSL